MNATDAMTAGASPGEERADAEDRALTRRALALTILAAGCVAFVTLNWTSPLRTAIALAFLLLGPGLAFAELVEVRDLALRLTVAISASLSLETLVALGLLYAHAFSVRLFVVLMAGCTLTFLGLALWRSGWLRSRIHVSGLGEREW